MHAEALEAARDAALALEPIGVYVHFPWCLKKCPYCDFLSLATERAAIPHTEYADQLIAELEHRARALGARRLASIFFGGGTPSLWEPRELGRVLARILAVFPAHADDVEISVECNPSSFDRDRARALVDQGVGRVSIGVQSLDARRLEFLGRLHDAAGGLRAVSDALAAGVPRVSADMIFGVQGQSPEDAAREVSRVAELGPTHLSAYSLTIEPGTQFGALARKNALPLLPDDLVAESFLAVDAALERAGFAHYEISNFARPGAEARHNLGYWRGHEYLGLGIGAWGTVIAAGERIRYRNTVVVGDYMAFDFCRSDVAPPLRERELIATETALSERILLGLRLADGVDLGAAGRELGVDAFPTSRERAIEKLVARGRLERDGDTLRIPKPAWLFADGTISELL
jgi:putative oxygen-independent coproporphyrinogen III oxidase